MTSSKDLEDCKWKSARWEVSVVVVVVVRKGSSSIAESKRRKENIEIRGDWCAWIDLDGTVSENG